MRLRHRLNRVGKRYPCRREGGVRTVPETPRFREQSPELRGFAVPVLFPKPVTEIYVPFVAHSLTFGYTRTTHLPDAKAAPETWPDGLGYLIPKSLCTCPAVFLFMNDNVLVC